MTDVCLILEGTYPYIVGGVSTWVHALIGGLPQFDFSLVHLAARAERERTSKFDLPPNLREIITVEIDGYQQPYQVARWQPGAVRLPRRGCATLFRLALPGCWPGRSRSRAGGRSS